MSTYRENSILETLDKLTKWTKIPELVEGHVRRRRMRFFSAATLLIASIGLAIILLFTEKYWIGYAALILSFSVGNFLPLYGPVKQALNPHDDADERDLMLRRDAYYVTFSAICVVAILGIWLIVGLAFSREWPREILIRVLIALSFYLMCLVSTVPTLYASWAVGKPIDDDE